MAAKQGLPIDFYDTLRQSMSSPESILCFLSELDVSLAFKNPESILRDLQTKGPPLSHCLELILSCGVWADPLGDWLWRTFPLILPAAPNECCHTAVLLHLVDYVYFTLPRSQELQGLTSFQDDRTFILRAPEAIVKLNTMKFEANESGNEDVGDPRGKFNSGKRISQAERKRKLRVASQKKKDDGTSHDEGLFRSLGAKSMPSSLEEAGVLSMKFHHKLKELLAKYVAAIRTESISAQIISSFTTRPTQIPQSSNSGPKVEPIITAVSPPDIVSPVALSAFGKPLKAALYFDSAADFGDWEVVVSNRAIRDIRSAQRRDRSFYGIIMKKIKELSHAHFSDDNQKPLVGGHNAVPVFEAKMTSDSRLVYHIHCQPDHSGDREHQANFGILVIRIFGVFTHTQLDRVWESLGYQLAQLGGREYRNRCCQRVYNRDNTLVIPAVFPPNNDVDDRPLPIPELPIEDLEEIHSILVLEKFVNFSKELCNSLLVELDVQHVFNLSPQEMAIIEHPHSCYVLGRSGTGKTTTMLFKMLGLERTFSLVDANGANAKPRQLFVTQSPVLAHRVEDYFAKLLVSLELGQKSESELAMAARARSGAALKSMIHKKDSRWKDSLPDRFSLLQDEHFPLFLTFEQLVGLIIGDLLNVGSSSLRIRCESLDEQGVRKFDALVRDLSAYKDIMKYPQFLADYWDHFPQDLTRGLDPAMVFSEIIGVIKGAEGSLLSERSYLDKKSYLNLSERANYIFASQRERIYALFMKYARRQRALDGYDAADRTHAILKMFNLVGVPGTRVDFLYVDEAQDNMLIDAMLLRSICKNPSGLFWAGDTAQTITVGNSFRFQDLKAFLHRLEERRIGHLPDSVPQTPSQKPASFSLSTNYRSHGGIIACAHSIVEMITRFWPSSLDKMTPEKGIVNGIKPLFLSSNNARNLHLQNLMGDGESDIEFGAAQCILVRDEVARERLLQEVGEVGIIMTLYDSKGLEFDDVLLYQFFGDSSMELSRWRVLLNILEQKAPEFDEQRHAGLCSELKFLYVAVTRARKKLWIYDTSNKAQPLQIVWSSFGLIETFDSSGSQNLPRFASSSPRQEWLATAETLFDNENYQQAVFAFKKAGAPLQAGVAWAYHLRKEAELTVPKSPRKQLFQEAAISFLRCAEEATRSDEKKGFRVIAGHCWREGEAYHEAAEAYRAAKEYGDALKMYRKVGMFDEGVQIIKHHMDDIPNKALQVVSDFKDAAKVFYLKEQEIGKAEYLFSSTDEVLGYLAENAYLDESRALFLEGLGRNMEAADVHLEEGRLLEAIRVLQADGENSQAHSRVQSIVIQALWKQISFANVGRVQESAVQKLIQLSSNFPEPLRQKVTVFSAIDQADWKQTRILGRQMLHADDGCPYALLCFSYTLHPDNLPEMDQFDNAGIAAALSDLLDFCSLLRGQAETLDLKDEGLQRLFDFQPSQVENMYTVAPGSWLYVSLDNLSKSPNSSIEGSLVASQNLARYLKDALLTFISDVIKNESRQSRTAPAFTPCLPFAMTGHCRFKEQCYRIHLTRNDLDQPWYTTQVRIHLQQILLSQIIESIPADLGGGSGNRRYWLNRLYQTLAPANHILGSGFTIKLSAIRESQRALGVAHNWCRHLLAGRPGTMRALELSSVYQATDLCVRLDREWAGGYIHRSRLIHGWLRHDPSYWRSASDGSNQMFVLPELLGSLDASRPDFLRTGVLFAEHIIDKKLPIDVNVLFTFIEFLSGSFIAAQHHFHWHNITLPRSWCLTILQRTRQQLPMVNTRYLLQPLMRTMNRILRILTTGEDASHLLYGKANVGPPPIRRLFIARMCRAMCLIGYNIPNEWLHNFTLEQLRPLKTSERHPLYLPFALAENWKHIVHAIWNSTKDSPFDDLVQLWLAEIRQPVNPPPKNVTRIIFKAIPDIAYLLRNEEPPAATSTGSDPSAASDVLHQVDPDLVDHPIVPNDDQAIDLEAMVPLGLEPSLEAEIVDPEAADTPDIEPGTEALGAAEVFHKAYQRLLRRRQCEKVRSPREVACRNYFEVCMKQVGNVDRPLGSMYKKVYLGIVPHLLVIMQWIQAYVSEEKAAAKEALKVAKGVDFENGMARMNRINVLAKMVANLQQRLEPESPLHLKQDIKDFRKIISEVEGLFTRLPEAKASEVNFDLFMAKLPVKEKDCKTPLGWDEDDYRFEYDEHLKSRFGNSAHMSVSV